MAVFKPTTVSKRLSSLLLPLLSLLSCQQESTQPRVANPPAQRPAATTVLQLGLYGNQSPFDTVTIGGITYPFATIDSTTYYYDQFDRLTTMAIRQIHQADAYPFPGATLVNQISTEYVYQANQVTIGSLQQPLDKSQRRLASHSASYFGRTRALVDTLLTYSPEGILIYSQLINRTGSATPTPLIIHQLSTLAGGNVVQTTLTYQQKSQPYQLTTYGYDLTRIAPLATNTLWGETSRNVVVRKTIFDYSLAWVRRYEYSYFNEYDQSGRLIRQTEYYLPEGSLEKQAQTLTKFYY